MLLKKASARDGSASGRKILWLTWKDRKNLLSGGAEVVNQEIGRRLVKDGYRVIFIVAGFPGGKREEIVDGCKIIRVGSRWSVYFKTYKYYQKHLRGWADLVIEEINTFPFLSQFYIHPVKSPAECGGARRGEQFNRARQKRVLIVYQLCREIWFYQIFFPMNLIGYLIEPIYLWLLRKNKVITISASTKNDLIKYGFRRKNIAVIPVGIKMKPIENLDKIKKYNSFTLLSLGAIRKMKRPDHQIKAFEIAKRRIPELKLKIAGAGYGRYYRKIIKLIANSPFKKEIEYLGRVSRDDKIELMQKSHLILVTSVKEGWGLIVTETNSQGTPAVVYNVDGLRDSVRNQETGIIVVKNTPEKLAEGIVSLLSDLEKYAKIKLNAWQWSQEFDFEKSYQTVLNKLKESL